MSQPSTGAILLSGEKETGLLQARIVSLSEGEYLLRRQEGAFKARVAFSCLVQPIPGDLVIFAETGDEIRYILGIIERPGEQKMNLTFPADANLFCDKGSLGIYADKAVTLAGDQINCLSDQAVHKSREAVVNYDELTAAGSTLQAHFSTVRLISRMINTMAHQVIERLQSYIRHTEGYDQIKAGQMSRKVDGLYTVDTKNTIMVSKKDTKIDGERIHMG